MKQAEWPWVMGLSVCGVADSLYLLLYQTHRIDHLVCPIFGDGCDKVVGSPEAYPAGIPDAIFGVAGYASAGLTAAAMTKARGRTRRELAIASVIGALGALGLSAYLTYAQPKKTGAWCTWCLLSAGISSAMAIVTLSGARKSLTMESEL